MSEMPRNGTFDRSLGMEIRAHVWTSRRGLLVSAVSVFLVLGPSGVCRPDGTASLIRSTGRVQPERWLNGTGGGSETSPAYVQALAAVVQAFEASSIGRAEATTRTRIDVMLEAARACGDARPPRLHFPETIWVCGGCILVEGWDWADLNAAHWIEPNEFLGADPTEAVSRAFLDCRKLRIEWFDDTAKSMSAATTPVVEVGSGLLMAHETDDESLIHQTFLALMLSLHDAEERWIPPEWDMVSPVDFTAYVGVSPNLRITMTGETFLLAEIDTRQGLAVLHTGGKRGVYRIDVADMTGDLFRGLRTPEAN